MALTSTATATSWNFPLRVLVLTSAFLLHLAAIDISKITVALTVNPQPSVSLSWDTQATGGTVEIFRRELGKVGIDSANAFVSLGKVSHPTQSFTDTTVTSNQAYEYRVYRAAFSVGVTNYKATAAYMAVTIAAPLEDQRGTVLLVTENTAAALMPNELQLLEMDLVGDGWKVVRLNFAAHGVGTHQDLRAAIQAAHSQDPSINALYLFGRLPVARSGFTNPDGHDPRRAHETDLYYADVDGTWTDTIDYTGSPGEETENKAGDGKFDHTDLPSAIELMTGRVDFFKMPAHRKNELEYLRDYIHKSHAWRHGQRKVPYASFNGSNGYLFMEYNWQRPMFGNGFDTAVDAFQPSSSTNPYLWAVEFGPWDGTDQSAYGAVTNKVIFSINFGSYKQHFIRENNAMRALLCQPDWGLTSCWGGRPAWHMHHMAAGKPVGYSALRTLNNGFNGTEYDPRGEYWYLDKFISSNLLGDPTLRLHPVPPLTALSVSAQGSAALLSWSAPSDAARVGYHVYRASDRLGPYTRLTNSPLPVAATEFVDATKPAGNVWYQIRSLATTTVQTGSYTNQSQGLFAQLLAGGTANSAPVANTLSTVEAISNVPTRIFLAGTDGDGDALVPIILSNPVHGQLRWNGSTAHYVSSLDYVGSDSLSYAMSDGLHVSAPQTVSIQVSGNGDMLLGWRFGSPAEGLNQVNDSTFHKLHMGGSVITKGSGLYTSTNAGQNAGAYFATGANATALDSNDWLGWYVAPESGYRQSLSRIAFFAFMASTYGASAPYNPCNLELRVSDDDFVTWTKLALEQSETPIGLTDSNNGGMMFSANLSSLPMAQATEKTLRFRLYIWNSNRVGLGKSGDNQAQNAYDLAIFGTVKLPNVPPVANAGSDTTVPDSDGAAGELVTLSASQSTDSDGTMVSYVWQENGTQIATGVNPSVTLSDGQHTLTLIVRDDEGATGSDTVLINVTAPIPNVPPVANAGSDTTVPDSDGAAGELVTLSADQSTDSDGTIVSYVWQENGTQIATGVNPSVTLSDGQHTLTLIVSDDDGATGSDTIIVTVISAPIPLWRVVSVKVSDAVTGAVLLSEPHLVPQEGQTPVFDVQLGTWSFVHLDTGVDVTVAFNPGAGG